ncbi:hypothetical protein OG921_03280 [Aldersonia sp. NBC_00410]|uniref:hypothetical protein n=1 Tax=Aldersonia sp. NBC_00410 TaxID=2975954 RepID=UPI002253BB35|nr:hypothetical protein [Aldersonia sp. NBC_00410]MCX5042213.1 hypothetical protein [Aldersonia sp. NBC_00410]
MSGFVRVEHERYRWSAQKFEDLAERLLRLKLNLEWRRDAEGACWGADEPGAAFASKYVAPAGSAIGSAETMVDVLAGVADRIRATADALQMTEQQHGSSMARITDRIGGGQ